MSLGYSGRCLLQWLDPALISQNGAGDLDLAGRKLLFARTPGMEELYQLAH